ncbi:MAG: NYN domain-containing protein [Pseudomonadota bacterium]
MALRTIVYVDGFNLYYGALKGHEHRWLDLKALFTSMLSDKHQIVQIKYFTAKVMSKPSDPNIKQRQTAYLSALHAYIPEIKIYYGQFKRNEVNMQNAYPPPRQARVLKTEEKGSDVNLSVHIVNDAWLDCYNCAVLVSNDSDMAEALRLVKAYHPNKKIGLLNPHDRRPVYDLKKHADFSRIIKREDILSAQLPDPIPGTNIHRPQTGLQ